MSTRRALAFSFLDRYSALLINIASSMLIARLMTPEEIGVYSVTVVLTTFVSAMRDFGAGQYLVQERELTAERIGATWAVLLVTGFAFSLLVALGAAPAAAFYGDQRMLPVMLVLSANFALNPVGSLTYAWLMREMRFDLLAIMRFASVLTGSVISVGLAWQSFGPISLAIGSLATTIANGLVAIWARPSEFSWRPHFGEVRRVLSFGSKVSANSILVVISGGIPELMLGKAHGLAAAALYSRANGLAAMFHRMVVDATQAVAMPMFSREMRERGRTDQSFLLATSYVTVLGWSFFAGLALLAQPVVRVLYGDQWDAAVIAARWLAVAMALALPSTLCASALLACGASGVMLRTTIVSLVLQIVAGLVASPWGIQPLAIAVTISYALASMYWLYKTQEVLQFSWTRFAGELGRSAVAAVVVASAAAVSTLLWGFNPSNRFLPLLLSLGLGIALLPAALFLSRHPMRLELQKLWARFR